MSILLDAIVVLLAVILIAVAVKKGFTVVFLHSVGRLAVLIAAWFLSWGISGWIYGTFLREPLIDRVGTSITSSVAGGIERTVTKALAALPDFLVSGMKGLGLTPDTIAPQVESAMSGQGETVASAIVDTAVAPIVILLLRAVLFVILFIIGMILLRVITRGASMVVNLPLIRQADMLFGAVMGVVNFAIAMFILTAAAALLIPLCGDSVPLLNSETIENSVIFKFLYHLNPITATIAA